MQPVVGINLPNSSYDLGVTRKYLSTFAAQGFDAVEVCLDTYPLIVDGEICEPWVTLLQSILTAYPLRYSAHIGRGLDCGISKTRSGTRRFCAHPSTSAPGWACRPSSSITN